MVMARAKLIAVKLQLMMIVIVMSMLASMMMVVAPMIFKLFSDPQNLL